VHSAFRDDAAPQSAEADFPKFQPPLSTGGRHAATLRIRGKTLLVVPPRILELGCEIGIRALQAATKGPPPCTGISAAGGGIQPPPGMGTVCAKPRCRGSAPDGADTS